VRAFASLVDYQHLLFGLSLVINTPKNQWILQHKIYAKVTRPFFLPTQIKTEKSGLAMQDYTLMAKDNLHCDI